MNNKQSFLNRYFVITVILIVVGGVYYFKFYKADDLIVDDLESGADKSISTEEKDAGLVNENKAPTPKVTPSAPSTPAVQTSPPTQTILLKNNFISIKNNSFNPSVIVVKRGTEITWTNEDNTAHQIASDSRNVKNPLPELGSKVMAKGDSYIFMFTKPGTFDYYCRLHPFMKGTIIVTE